MPLAVHRCQAQKLSRSEHSNVENVLNDSSFVAQRCSILAHNDTGSREGNPQHDAGSRAAYGQAPETEV